MTSKRLGILLFILAFVWSVAGLGWSTLLSSTGPDGILGIGPAHADPVFADRSLAANTLDGDPDSFANSQNGDPDAFTKPPSSSDSTGTGTPAPSDGTRGPSLWDVILDGLSMLSTGLGWH